MSPRTALQTFHPPRTVLLSSIRCRTVPREVKHVGSRVPPPTDEGLDVKFASRAVQQVRGQYHDEGEEDTCRGARTVTPSSLP
jgi:hypothetical protein